MIPVRFAPVLFGLILSGLMSLVVSGIATLRAIGWGVPFAGAWAGAWLMAWLFGFPIVLLAAPLTRRVVARMIEREPR
jgi:hypothetical protein